uniref:Uncharacterized protein n=1 Tax=Hucho hucho TaxID=62062 RepID=A0A4W5JYI0_9TELE
MRRSSFSSSDSGRTKPGLALKRTGSNANQYGLYGKTRAEEDAKLYLREKEELERERDGIRNTLLTLRQERREVKERFKTATGKREITHMHTHIHNPFGNKTHFIRRMGCT